MFQVIDIPRFDEAVERLRGFLIDQNLPGEVLWICKEDVFVRKGETFVWTPLRPENEQKAREVYDAGRHGGIGVRLAVFCLLGATPCCYPWAPKDDIDAQYAMVSGLKLSVPHRLRIALSARRTWQNRFRQMLQRPSLDPWLDELPSLGRDCT